MASRWYGLNVLAVEQFDDSMLCELFELASQLKTMVRTQGKCDLLRGKILANVFMEPSTRTMCSFDAAMKRLGGEVISVNESGSSAKKGETIQDTVRCLQCYCDALVLRHPLKGSAAAAAAAASKPLINAGDGTGEHPTQALLDLFTIASARTDQDPNRRMTDLSKLTITLLGDLKHGRTVSLTTHFFLSTHVFPHLSHRVCFFSRFHTRSFHRVSRSFHRVSRSFHHVPPFGHPPTAFPMCFSTVSRRTFFPPSVTRHIAFRVGASLVTRIESLSLPIPPTCQTPSPLLHHRMYLISGALARVALCAAEGGAKSGAGGSTVACNARARDQPPLEAATPPG